MPYKRKEDLYRAQKRHRLSIRAKLFSFLSVSCCVDCGESDPVVLDFDHKIREQKFKSVSKMLSGHYSWRSVCDEINKCDVRCANCHRRRTYKQQGSWGRTTPS